MPPLFNPGKDLSLDDVCTAAQEWLQFIGFREVERPLAIVVRPSDYKRLMKDACDLVLTPDTASPRRVSIHFQNLELVLVCDGDPTVALSSHREDAGESKRMAVHQFFATVEAN